MNTLPNQLDVVCPKKMRNREDYKSLIENYLINQKPYLIHGFSLQDLSAFSGINIPTLSALINKEYRMNFNDFVNQYRVMYFKNLLILPEYHQWTLEAIAQKAGFNSRTTFIRAFTKFSDCSPSKYLKFVKMNYLMN
jgi:AraC-like DNA-binding protein